MKRLNIATLVAVMAISAAYAQSMVEDVDGDGVYSKEELMVVYPALTDEVFAEVDANDDGAIDAEELAAAQEAGLLAI
jgi:Ca2+-binding EF-hand superfamily protein